MAGLVPSIRVGELGSGLGSVRSEFVRSFGVRSFGVRSFFEFVRSSEFRVLHFLGWVGTPFRWISADALDSLLVFSQSLVTALSSVVG